MDDTGSRVGKIYAQALFELADGAGAIDVIKEDMETLTVVITQQKDFAVLLGSPSFSDEYKEQLVRRIFSGKLAEMMLDFLMVVIEHNRTQFLPQIAARYNELWEAHYGYRPVQVTVSRQMRDDEIKKLYADIATAVNKRVKLELNIEPSIIGGIAIRYEDTVIDNTVSARLHRAVRAITSRQERTGKTQ